MALFSTILHDLDEWQVGRSYFSNTVPVSRREESMGTLLDPEPQLVVEALPLRLVPAR